MYLVAAISMERVKPCASLFHVLLKIQTNISFIKCIHPIIWDLWCSCFYNYSITFGFNNANICLIKKCSIRIKYFKTSYKSALRFTCYFLITSPPISAAFKVALSKSKYRILRTFCEKRAISNSTSLSCCLLR